jgi:hypothetical protein
MSTPVLGTDALNYGSMDRWVSSTVGCPVLLSPTFTVPDRSVDMDLPISDLDHVDTMVATGGTPGYTWKILSQELV